VKPEIAAGVGGEEGHNERRVTMTPVEIGGGVSAIKAVLDVANSIASTAKSISDAAVKAEVNDRVIEIRYHLMGLQAVIIQLQKENHGLKQQLKVVADIESVKKQYRYEETVSWKCDEAGNRTDGPFCPNCIDEGVVRRLNPEPTKGLFSCVHHKTAFRTAEYGEAYTRRKV
jgi:hypothetical protein